MTSALSFSVSAPTKSQAASWASAIRSFIEPELSSTIATASGRLSVETERTFCGLPDSVTVKLSTPSPCTTRRWASRTETSSTTRWTLTTNWRSTDFVTTKAEVVGPSRWTAMTRTTCVPPFLPKS